ncbi:radical SAM protein [Clostridium fermenticellae]|uniref:Radical SAM protein n=1 Tax=Clostridium fermenticellae TaxID=2068654 RepID=A0A386H0J7_9CLOT|nr:radical SAM protein [Clostridium fermenticellae]AYD39158.1 radical SAM protein [Clostridium fermenticellae]
MENSDQSLWNCNFSHIYVEKDAVNNVNTKTILRYFKDANKIYIDSYKEIFNRSHQSFNIQKKSINLILAIKKDNFIYKGADVCENFGNKYFYYTSSIMNCIYNCEYCYLKGMYPSANIVIWVNVDDTFKEISEILKQHPMYICISYDTDLLALETVTSFVNMWIDFAKDRDNLKLELRTKSSNFNSIANIKPIKNMIIAWTLSPEYIIERFEKDTPSFKKRISSIKMAIDMGWKVRICFDPLIYVDNWREVYSNYLNELFNLIPAEKIYDISIGVFRISKTYFKNMKKQHRNSYILAYPFEYTDGVYSYREKDKNELVDFVYNLCKKYVNNCKIYV